MPDQIGTSGSEILSLAANYSTPYSAIIHEDVVMGVPRYFLERWVPILGTNPATVVNTLRQISYRRQDKNITISGSALAREAAMSRRHLYTCFDTPWFNAFVRQQSGQRIRTDDGQFLQRANRYTVRMDDPIAPADAEHLVTVLQNAADDPLEAARCALDQPPRELWAPSLSTGPSHFIQPRAIVALDIMQRAFPTWHPVNDNQKNEFAQLAEQLHRHVTLVHDTGRTSKIIVPQYFRQQWWSRLGHDLAWCYLWLRGHVFEDADEGIHRDTCWVPSLSTLLDLIGRPREWWRRNVEKAKPKSNEWAISDFFAQIASQKGRDSAHPQWVARQFRVALTIPIAPEDRARYTNLLKTWPEDGFVVDSAESQPSPQVSATVMHTGSPEVCHSDAHRFPRGLPHLNTSVQRGSATSEHTGIQGVCHSQTQGSATSEHTESESQKQASRKKPKVQFNTNKFLKPTILPSPATKPVVVGLSTDKLIDLFDRVLENAPKTPLFRVANSATWLQQTWPEPIRPHTPVWTLVMEKKISHRDLVALMLAIWADDEIKYPPRYLSWLAQRWQTLPETPPVDHWSEWQKLAEIPIGKWFTEGRKLWIELASRAKRALPFGLDVLEYEHRQAELASQSPASEASYVPVMSAKTPQSAPEPESNGLDFRPGDGMLSIAEVWHATLGQLSAQLNQSTYANWVEGARAVFYADGVLTVRARHPMARDWLAQRLNHSIEKTASMFAEMPIKICYTAD